MSHILGTVVLLNSCLLTLGSIDPAHLFCQEVTGLRHSYCKGYLHHQYCQGSRVRCSAGDVASFVSLRSGNLESETMHSSTSFASDFASVDLRNRYCQDISADQGSYCKFNHVWNRGRCHGSDADCSMKVVEGYYGVGSSSSTTTSSPDPTFTPSTTTPRPQAPDASAALDPWFHTQWPFQRDLPVDDVEDVCELADAVPLGKNPTSGDSYFLSIDSLRACMTSTRITHANALWTLHNLYFGVSETYSFTSIAVNSQKSNQTNECGFKVHAVSVDLQASLRAQIAAYNAVISTLLPSQVDEYLNQERPAYEFHSALLKLMNKLHDGHTLYSTPYSMFRVYFPFSFGSHMDDGHQVVTLKYSIDPATPLGRLAYAYQRVYGAIPIPSRFEGSVVSRVNGVPVLEFLLALVADEGPLAAIYQQAEQRLNAYVFNAPMLVLGQVLAPLPEYDSVSIEFASGETYSVRLLGQFADLSTSPYYAVPHLRSTASLSSYMHSNPAFSAFIATEETESVSKKSSLWKHAADAASTPAMHEVGLMASQVSHEYWRRLSARHKAMLDPVKNFARDHLLNIPADDGEDTAEPARVEFEDADGLRALIDKALIAGVGRSRSPSFVALAVSPYSPAAVEPGVFTAVGSMLFAFFGDTVVVQLPSMAPEPRYSGDIDYLFFPELVQIQKAARSKDVTRLLFDVTRNAGGSVLSTYALLWYVMADRTKICAPLRKRVTKNWRMWIDSFGQGLEAVVDQYLVPKGEKLADEIDAMFAEIASLVTLMYDGLGLTFDQLGGVAKDTALMRVHAAKQSILSASPADPAGIAAALVEYIKTASFVPENAEVKDAFVPMNGFAPFDPFEFARPKSRGRTFIPLLSNYKHPETREWGGATANYSQPGEFTFCQQVMAQMPQRAKGYLSGYWTQVGVVSDGTCGSACALFTQAVQTNGDAVGFTYGGLAGVAMDTGTFAGGTVEDYDMFWPKLAFAARLGHLASGGKAPWAIEHADSWVAHPIAFPTKAGARFNWNMMFAEALGKDALPRQFYLIPPRKHFDIWADPEAVYGAISEISDWAALPAQFAETHGQCPLEITPFAKKQTKRSY